MKPLGPLGFKGGWNTKESSWTFPRDSMSDAQNINLVHMDIMKRQGNAFLNLSVLGSSAAVHGLFDWLINSGIRYLIATVGSKIYNSAALSSTFSDITGAATITAGQNNQHTFSSLNNIVAICGGTTPDTPLQWTGTGNVSSLAGSPPAGALTCTANNFMFLSAIAANPSRVYWSNVADPGTWGASNFIDFRASDGDSVTSIIELNQNLLIFKRRSIGLLFTQSNTVSGSTTLAPLTEVIVGIGCPGGQCTENLPDGSVIFLGTNAHVYLIQGGTSVIDISDPKDGSNIQPTLDSMNISRLPFAVVKFYPTRNQVWISISSSSATTNDTVLIYDTQVGVWVSPFTNINANVMEPTIDTRATPSHPVLMVTGDYGGQIYEQDRGNADISGTPGAIDGWGTICIRYAVDETEFVPRSIAVPFEAQSSGNLQIGYGFNGLTTVNTLTNVSQQQAGDVLDSTFIMDTSVLVGPASLRKILPIVSNGREYSIQIKVRNFDTNTSGFTVHPIFLSDEVMV